MKIAHVSDLHIRTIKRHQEYLQFFDLLYKSLKEQQPDIITFLGDLCHQKGNISASQIKLIFDFLKEISTIAPLYLILGNHDCNLCNPDELDPLTPIIENLKDYNITYLKKSGIYSIKENPNFNFVVFSLLDGDWTQKEHINKNSINIGLYHGLINSAYLENGLMIDGSYELKYFMDKVDYLMLGDIHQQQFLNKEKTAAYPGSVLQQNYSESLEKGYLLWSITSKDEFSVDFIEIPCPCPFYTLKLNDDLLIDDKMIIQPNSRIRILSKQLNLVEKNEIEQKIRSLYFPKEIKFLDQENAAQQEIKINKNLKIENLSSITVQNKLILNFLKQYKLEDTLLTKIYDLNEDYNTKARQQEKIVRNVVYKIENMKFSNIFSFGENNTFNFADYKGIVGVFGSNAVGKSSLIVDAPLYGLFNRVSKKGVVKNDLIINEDKDECKVELNVSSEKGMYNIVRRTSTYVKAGKKKGNAQVQGRTDVVLKLINGTEKNLTGETRADTDLVIENLFGTYDDFLRTAIAPQWRLNEFIETGGTERQKLIGKYFDVDLFQIKYDLAIEDKRDIKSKIEIYENINFEDEIERYKFELEQIEKQIILKEMDKDKQSDCLGKILSKIESIKSKMFNVKMYSKNFEQIAQEKIKNTEEKIVSMNCKINDCQNDINKTTGEIEHLKQEKEKYNLKELREQYNKYLKLSNKIDLLKMDDTIDEKVDYLDKKINSLKKYDCLNNENCCMLKELKKLEQEKEQVIKNRQDHKKQIEEIKKIIEEEQLKKVYEKIEKCEQLKKQIEKEEWGLEITKKDAQINKEKLNSFKKDKKQMEDYLKEYYENIENIKKNNEYGEEIKILHDQKDNIELTLYDINANRIELSNKLGTNKARLEELKKQKESYEQLREKYMALDFYLKAMAKDGIARRIVIDNLGIINGEISRLLSSNCSFTVELQADDKNNIEIYFCPEKGKRRLIEQCSGFEKAICSILIRAALIGVSTLPKFQILVLDESFENISKENLNIAIDILNNLKSKFETIFLISHNDLLKDYCDQIVMVYRNDQGFSKVE